MRLSTVAYQFWIKLGPTFLSKNADNLLKLVIIFILILPYREWKRKEEIEDNKEDDTITFYQHDTFIFRPDLSNGLTGNEMIITVHPVVSGTALTIFKTRPTLMSTIKGALNKLYSNPSPFVNIRAMDYMFDGFPIDCGSDDFAVQAVCSGLEGLRSLVLRGNKTHLFFSLFGAINATNTARVTVYRGMKNLKNLAKVIKVNDEDEMETWATDECNQFSGTDGTKFPPGLSISDGVTAFVPGLCRSFRTTYQKPSSYVGIKTSRYTLDFGDPPNDETLHCYCDDPPEACPPKGSYSLQECMGVPLIVSLPHFLNADPALLAGVIGLDPDDERHSTKIDFEQISGTPVKALNRLQFSWSMEPIDSLDYLKDVREAYIPAFWLEEELVLNKTFTNMLRYQLFIPLTLSKIFNYSLYILGISGAVFFAVMEYKRRTDPGKVVIIDPINKTQDDKSNVEIKE